jgi:hypothetical protein
MTELQTLRTRALAEANLGQNHRAARFVRDMARLLKSHPEQKLTDRQAGYLIGLAWSFRRQLPAALRPAQNPYESHQWSQIEERDNTDTVDNENVTAEQMQMEEQP